VDEDPGHDRTRRAQPCSPFCRRSDTAGGEPKGIDCSLQEAAANGHLGAELIVERVVQGQEMPNIRGQTPLHLRAQQLLLILLLRLVATAVEGVQKRYEGSRSGWRCPRATDGRSLPLRSGHGP
jgi:hypothetical protein